MISQHYSDIKLDYTNYANITHHSKLLIHTLQDLIKAEILARKASQRNITVLLILINSLVQINKI